MTIKKPSERRSNRVSAAEIEALADQLADRPYAADAVHQPKTEKLARTAISLPGSLLRRVEDLAIANKRSGVHPKNVSAIVREALEQYLSITSYV